MSAEGQDLRASERFDESVRSAPDDSAEHDAWEDYSLIADHLRNAEVITLPVDFAQEVQRKIIQRQRRRDLLLVLQTGFVTALILTFVAATALGFNWWERLLDIARPGNVSAAWAAFSASLPAADLELSALYLEAKPFLRFLPGGFLVAAIAALLLELAVFRLLRIGPFQLKAENPSNPHDILL